MADRIADEAILEAAQELHDKAFDMAVYERDEAKNAILVDGGQDLGYDPPTDEEIREQLEWVVGRFREFLSPCPRDFDQLIAKVKKIEAAFGADADVPGGTAAGVLADSTRQLGGWDGELAKNLTENFLRPMPVIAANQGKLASYLRDHAEKMQSVYECGRQNALTIAKRGIEALDAITICRSTDLMIALAALIAAKPLPGPVLTAATSMVVQLTNAGVVAGSDIGGPFAEQDDKLPIGGDTVEQVMDHVWDALNTSRKRIFEEEGYLMDALKQTERAVLPAASGRTDNGTALLPMRPKISGATDEEITKGLRHRG